MSITPPPLWLWVRVALFGLAVWHQSTTGQWLIALWTACDVGVVIGCRGRRVGQEPRH